MRIFRQFVTFVILEAVILGLSFAVMGVMFAVGWPITLLQAFIGISVVVCHVVVAAIALNIRTPKQ